jgi:hypothetical protein
MVSTSSIIKNGREYTDDLVDEHIQKVYSFSPAKIDPR